jgi:hypothetical protein
MNSCSILTALSEVKNLHSVERMIGCIFERIFGEADVLYLISYRIFGLCKITKICCYANINVLRDVRPCSFVDSYQLMGESC